MTGEHFHPNGFDASKYAMCTECDEVTRKPATGWYTHHTDDGESRAFCSHDCLEAWALRKGV